MAKQHEDERDHRIHYEIIVDAYDDQEVAMSWYYYMEEKLEFPIMAKVKLPVKGGKTEEKSVKIVEIDPKSETSLNLRLGITESGGDRIQYISLDDIISAETSEENLEVLNDWLYWSGHPLIDR